MGETTSLPRFEEVGSSWPMAAPYPPPWTEPPPDDAGIWQDIAATYLQDLNAALQDVSTSRKLHTLLLADDSFWRDYLTLTWDLRCFRGADAVQSALKTRGDAFIQSIAFSLDGLDHTVADGRPRAPALDFLDLGRTVPILLFFATVVTSQGSGRAVLRLVQDAKDGGRWKAVTIFTMLDALRGVTEPHGPNRLVTDQGPPHGVEQSTYGKRTSDFTSSEPTVLVVGGGHSGLMAAARLEAQGVDALVVEKNPRVGDNWRNRYDGLNLHDHAYMNEFPYLKYPTNWPVYPSKDRVADFLETYATTLDLRVWTSVEVQSAEWNEIERRWNVHLTVRKDGQVHDRTLRPRYLVHTIMTGRPSIPSFPGRESFAGDRLIHSSEFTSAGECAGKSVIVVGTGNSAHDIATEYAVKGARVTIVQRGSSAVMSQRTFESMLKRYHNENTVSAELADLEANSMPMPMAKRLSQEATQFFVNVLDRDLIVGLGKAGYAMTLGPDEAGLLFQALTRVGRFYVSVGRSADLIIDGTIRVARGSIDRVEARSVVLDDGTSLPADEIILATGYSSIDKYLRETYGGLIANQLGPVFGLDEEGEMRSLGRKTTVDGFFISTNNFMFSRLLSKLVALQIKAREEGLVD